MAKHSFVRDSVKWLGGFETQPAGMVQVPIDFHVEPSELPVIGDILKNYAKPFGVTMYHRGLVEENGSQSVMVSGSPNAVAVCILTHNDELGEIERKDMVQEFYDALLNEPSGRPGRFPIETYAEWANGAPGNWFTVGSEKANANMVTRIRSGSIGLDPSKYVARSYKELDNKYGIEIMRVTDEETDKSNRRDAVRERLRPIFDEMLEKAVDAAMLELQES